MQRGRNESCRIRQKWRLIQESGKSSHFWRVGKQIQQSWNAEGQSCNNEVDWNRLHDLGRKTGVLDIFKPDIIIKHSRTRNRGVISAVEEFLVRCCILHSITSFLLEINFESYQKSTMQQKIHDRSLEEIPGGRNSSAISIQAGNKCFEPLS